MINCRPLAKGEVPNFTASDFTVYTEPSYFEMSNDELIDLYDKLSLDKKLIRLMNFGDA